MSVDSYVQLDELLSQPATRLLRALRFFDWVSSSDLYVALDVGDHEQSAFSAALARSARDGFVDRNRSGGVTYRLTAAGRRELERRLRGESRMQPARLRKCSLCRGVGHYAKSCREARAA